MSVALYDLDRTELEALFARWGFRPYARRLWRALYREGLDSLASLPAWPPELLDRLRSETHLPQPAAVRASESRAGSARKYLLQLEDAARMETVLMPSPGRATACLSSQAGCPLGCVFCATGQIGFTRNLSTAEIVAQAIFAWRLCRGSEGPGRLRNIVLMGMGEPLLNYEAVLRAVRIFTDSGGLAIARKRVTLSTVGVIPGIIRLADDAAPCALAVSLHAADQERRAALVPAARAWPLDDLIEACRYYVRKTGRKIFFEWTLIEGENDSLDQARQLAALLAGIDAHVNLIPLNPTPGYCGPASRAMATDQFHAALRDLGIPATIRRRRGIDIDAGCGQLAAAGTGN